MAKVDPIDVRKAVSTCLMKIAGWVSPVSIELLTHRPTRVTDRASGGPVRPGNYRV